jgi:predicted DNA binding CopG/RHH family protein
MKKTIQLGLRIDEELLEKIEKMAQYENIDKMSWIRRALATFLKGEEIEAKTEAIEDYINLRIDEKDLKNISGMKEVSKDIQEARKEVLNKIKQEAKGK